ncbi:MAG: hypothetical protein ACE5H1_09830 [Thermodesulfobacteriota bacterium]
MDRKKENVDVKKPKDIIFYHDCSDLEDPVPQAIIQFNSIGDYGEYTSDPDVAIKTTSEYDGNIYLSLEDANALSVYLSNVIIPYLERAKEEVEKVKGRDKRSLDGK